MDWDEGMQYVPLIIAWGLKGDNPPTLGSIEREPLNTILRQTTNPIDATDFLRLDICDAELEAIYHQMAKFPRNPAHYFSQIDSLSGIH